MTVGPGVRVRESMVLESAILKVKELLDVAFAFSFYHGRCIL